MSTTIHSEFAPAQQGYRLEQIERINSGAVLRHRVQLDTSYLDQSSVTCSALLNGAWVELVRLWEPSFAGAPSYAGKNESAKAQFCVNLVVKMRKVAEKMV